MESTVDGSGRVFPIVQGTEIHTTGLTKRELFTAMAMQGMLAGGADKHQAIMNASYAVQAADALIEELNK